MPFPSPQDLPNPGVKPSSLMSLALADGFFTAEPPGKPHEYVQLREIKVAGQLVLR